MKHELLSPAGDMESLQQAIANGADAVYVGCKSFGARKFAKNFDNDEIVSAIRLCHLYGVKIYITMNTSVKDSEVEDFLKQVEFLHKNGVDAILIQDFGMINMVRQKYPNLEVHASTQANASTKDTIELLKKIGVTRVVLPREMDLKEIKELNVDIEKEVFVHGALCICYSGCCLMSSMLGTRSGNRGECAGSCRLPYTLKKEQRIISENEYLLSTKELNTTPKFKELLDSNILSFKIEGRMKSPEYVGFITRLYRTLIDTYCTNVNLEKKTEELKTVFNRGFTTGNLFEATPNELMNTKSPNHIGLEIGRVIGVTDKKIKIKLSKSLNQQDGIRFLKSGKGFIVNYIYDENDNLINSADDICYVDNKVNLQEYDKVCKTQDYNLINDYKKLPARKVPITFKVHANVGKPLLIEINDGVNNLSVQGSNVEKSITSPMDASRIRFQLEKLGDTPFVSKQTLVLSDNDIFISVKELNEIRRTLVNNLIETRMTSKKEMIINEVKLEPIKLNKETGFTAQVYTKEQLEVCRRFKFRRIYTPVESLYNSYKMYENVYYTLPRNKINPIDLEKRFNLVSEYFDYTEKDNTIGNYTLNVYNIYTAYFLYKLGIETVTLSVELTDEEIINFLNTYVKTFNAYPNIELLCFGNVENMIIKGNILNITTNDYDYKLIDLKKREFPVYFDGNNTHILNFESKSITQMKLLKDYANMRLDFFNETEEETLNIVKKYQ